MCGYSALLSSVYVSVHTESETNNMQIDIYRSLHPDGEPELIRSFPGNGTTDEPHVFLHRDQDTIPGQFYFYEIVDVDSNGIETAHPEWSTSRFA